MKNVSSSNLTHTSADVLAHLTKQYPNEVHFRRKQIHDTALSLGYSIKEYSDLIADQFKVRRGHYNLSALITPEARVVTPAPKAIESAPATLKLAAQVSSTINTDSYVPAKDPTFVKWGHYDDVLRIIESSTFYPTYISGLSGNGKTTMVEQACANLGREYVRVQISPETDEDDLIGGFRLVNGETVFAKGPVVKAMERGSILLIDEIDRATNKIMCLQGVLEGKPVLIKKTGEVIFPAPGFNVIATANTKGKGSESGRFVSAGIIDEAFLERFVVTIEQPYPNLATERRIVSRHMEKYGFSDNEFAEKLCTWSEVIRKTFEAEGVDEVISTRRLCHIVHTFSIFTDRLKAIQMCISRFDEDTKTAFLDLYTKIDPSILPPKKADATPVAQDIPAF